MLVINGTVRLSPERMDEARPVMAAMIIASRAEPGCIDYSYAEDVMEPGLIRVAEIWSDQASLDAHFSSAHIAEWRASWAELGIHDRKLTLYESGHSRPV